MADITAKVKQLARKLSPDISFDGTNFNHLPEYCRIDFNDVSSLVIALGAKEQYVVSYIRDGTMTSCLTSDMTSDAVVRQLLEPERASMNVKSSSATQPTQPTQLQDKSNSFSSTNSSSTSRLRDPNFPPGFEDEHLLRRQPPQGPTLQFNPDADRLPPGGNYPTLGPINGPFGSNSRGGGMFPSIRDGSQGSPNIRYDPTSPFDVGGADKLHDEMGYRGAGGSGFPPF